MTNAMKHNTSHPSMQSFYRSRERMVHESVRVHVTQAHFAHGHFIPEMTRRVVTGGTANIGRNKLKAMRKALKRMRRTMGDNYFTLPE